jgi:hypothetical protein
MMTKVTISNSVSTGNSYIHLSHAHKAIIDHIEIHNVTGAEEVHKTIIKIDMAADAIFQITDSHFSNNNLNKISAIRLDSNIAKFEILRSKFDNEFMATDGIYIKTHEVKKLEIVDCTFGNF